MAFYSNGGGLRYVRGELIEIRLQRAIKIPPKTCAGCPLAFYVWGFDDYKEFWCALDETSVQVSIDQPACPSELFLKKLLEIL